MYFITSILHQEPKFDCRCFGYFETLEEAKEAVLENRGSISESLYNYCVIEAIGPGIHAEAFQQIWFTFSNELNKWEISTKPEELKGIVNWAIG